MAIVTLTSDIGSRDYVISAVKAKLLTALPGVQIVDISHDLNPFNYPHTAYLCRNAIKYFPEGTMHLVFVNLFDKKPDNLLLAQHKGQYIGCADNGLLTMILEEIPEKVVGLPLEKRSQKNVMYLTDVFIKAFRAIEEKVDFELLGNASIDYEVKNNLRPLLSDNWMEGQIIFVDNFENVIINITREEFEQQRRGREFTIIFRKDEKINKISESYADVPEGEKLALFNSAGYLELAVNKGNAAGLFGLESFSEKYHDSISHVSYRLVYQKVRIQFDTVNDPEGIPNLPIKLSHHTKNP